MSLLHSTPIRVTVHNYYLHATTLISCNDHLHLMTAHFRCCFFPCRSLNIAMHALALELCTPQSTITPTCTSRKHTRHRLSQTNLDSCCPQHINVFTLCKSNFPHLTTVKSAYTIALPNLQHRLLTNNGNLSS